MFNGWQAFYQVTGEAAGALVALLFIVSTLSASSNRPASPAGARLYTTPTVFLLALVIAESALALVPEGEARSAAWVMTAAAAAGCVNMLTVAAQLHRAERPHWSDFWCYGVAPVVVCLALALACGATATAVGHAPYAVALTLLALLMLAIRNAWDLVTFLAARQS